MLLNRTKVWFYVAAVSFELSDICLLLLRIKWYLFYYYFELSDMCLLLLRIKWCLFFYYFELSDVCFIITSNSVMSVLLLLRIQWCLFIIISSVMQSNLQNSWYHSVTELDSVSIETVKNMNKKFLCHIK